MKKNNLWILVVLLGTLLLVGCSSNSPEATARDFYHAIDASKMDQAMDLAYLGEQSKSKSENEVARSKLKLAMEEMKEKMAKHGGIDNVVVDEVKKVDDTHANVVMTIHMKNGEKVPDVANTVLVDGHWKIKVF